MCMKTVKKVKKVYRGHRFMLTIPHQTWDLLCARSENAMSDGGPAPIRSIILASLRVAAEAGLREFWKALNEVQREDLEGQVEKLTTKLNMVKS
jgi:hypothetical protein